MESLLSFLLFTFWFWLKLFLLINQSIPGSLKCLCLFSKYFNWITQFFLVLLNMNCFFFIMFVGLNVLVHITFDSGLCYLELLTNDRQQLVAVIVDYVLDLPNEFSHSYTIWSLKMFLSVSHSSFLTLNLKDLTNHFQDLCYWIGSQFQGYDIYFLHQIWGC